MTSFHTNSKVWIVALLVCGLSSSAAWAHPKLLKSVPAHDSTLKETPAELVLQFNEDVEPSLSKIAVLSDSGSSATSEDKPTHAGDAKNTLRVALNPGLSAGKYTVKWKAMSTDTHKLKGEFHFTIKGK